MFAVRLRPCAPDGAPPGSALPPPRRRPWWRHLRDQLVHFFALLLWGAAARALVAGLPQLALAIAVVVLVNGVFAFAEERGAARAAARLRDLLPRQVTVVRDEAHMTFNPKLRRRDEIAAFRDTLRQLPPFQRRQRSAVTGQSVTGGESHD